MKRIATTGALAGLAAWLAGAGLALAEEAAQAAQAAPPEEVTESAFMFVSKGGPIGWVILGLLVIAVFFVADQLRVHLLERLRAGEIYKANLAQATRKTFGEIIARSATSRVGRLLQDAQTLYDQSGNLSLIGAEAEFYREKEEHRLGTFESRMAFLADTAGGLGLLGTVWGIYRGFAAKSVVQNNQDLLAAMGLALVTTFLGIVVSVIVNWMATEIGAMTRNRTMVALEKIENFRDALVRERNAA